MYLNSVNVLQERQGGAVVAAILLFLQLQLINQSHLKKQ